jgi:Icc-related predicted phosphoesterase
MRLLLFSDVHCDEAAARDLVRRSPEVDVLVCAGDLAVMRRGLDRTVRILADATCPAVLVAGNGESATELASACSGWELAHVLHGSGCEIEGLSFWGLGGAIPVTPFGTWSFDLSEDEAHPLLAACPSGGVLVTHAPPLGHVDTGDGGVHLGSRAVLDTIERQRPHLAVCGHIHACWGQESRVGDTRVVNAGPGGLVVDVQI